jgi:tetratricopeptide (TPR) repeat protein
MTAINHIKEEQKVPDSISIKLALLLSQKLVSVSLFHEAANYLRDTINNLGQDIELRYQLALLDSQLENFAEAQRVFESILQDDPNHSGALNGLGFLLAEQSKELDRALDLVAKALKLHPDDAAIIDSLGWILYKRGDHQEAAKVLAKAHQLLKDPEISAHFIEALWQLNRQIEASDVAGEALKQFPNSENLQQTIKKFNIIHRGQPQQ